MNKREFLKTLALAGASLPFVSLRTIAAAESVLPRFAVISDLHFVGNISAAKVARTLKTLIAKGNLDAIFVVGDLTNNGRAAQYDLLLKVFKDTSIIPESQRVVFMMGNHEFYNNEDSFANYGKLQQPLHQYIDIKGFPFITISMNGGGGSSYGDDAKQFLAEKLADAAEKYPNKPIFVFSHVPPQDTTYGSHSWGTKVFSAILEKFPQTVFFSGHTHTPIGDPRMIWQGAYTSINDGSNTYACVEVNELTKGFSAYSEGYFDYPANANSELSNGLAPEEAGKVQEGLIVNVKSGTFLDIERWDTARNEEMPRWNVDWKNKNYKNRDGKPAPEFASGAKVNVQSDGATCTVVFPQAKDNEVVFRYFVELKDGDNVIVSYKKFSQFYLNSQTPETLSVKFEKLPSGKKLIASVIALDSFDNKSEAIVSEAFEIG